MDNKELMIAYAEGKLTYEEFEAELWLNDDLWRDIQSMVPEDIADPQCPFRDCSNYIQGLESNNYSVRGYLASVGYHKFFTYGLISELVKYNYPSVVCKLPIEQTSQDILEKLHLEYIDGPEVDMIIRTAIQENKSKLALKKNLKKIFPCKGLKHPIWVQEAEWPMGLKSPMMFISQNKDGDLYKYVFKDIDTGEIKTIEQYM